MHGCKFPARVGLLLISAVLITLLLHRGFDAPPTPPKTRPIVSYVLRGRLVEKHFQAYRDSLDRYGASLAKVLKAEAPDLLARFEAHEPARVGYQVLPTIVADLTSDERRPLGITAYSWPWTDRLIEQEQRKIVTEKLALRRAAAMSVLGSRLLLEALVRVYGRLKDQQSLIDAHIRYNRFWQAAIAANPQRFKQETQLQELVLRRRDMDGYFARIESAFEFLGWFEGLLSPQWSGLVRNLHQRQARLDRQIAAVLDPVKIPGFVRIEQKGRERLVHVPLWTDIPDRSYRTRAKSIIESVWRVSAPRQSFRVVIELRYISTDQLYKGGIEPQPGNFIELLHHLSRFPPEGGILTTGAITTHVLGRAIVLGPSSITPRELAHEFGHVLGFRDGYIRGYQDLGADGLEITEVITDPTDIMAAPSTGFVQAKHFQRLINQREKPGPGLAPAKPAHKTSRV